MRALLPLRLPLAAALPALLALLPLPARAAAGPWHDDGPAALRLLSPWSVAPRGAELALGLEVALDPGWHIYWLNSGDAGYPPRLDFRATAGLSGMELQFPVPHRYELPGELVAFGYGERLVYPLTARGGFHAVADLAIAGTVDYVVCASECIPFTSQLTLAQRFGDVSAADPATQPLLATWRSRVPAPAPSGIATARAFDLRHAGGTLELAFTGLPAPPVDLFFAPHELVELGKPLHRRSGDGDLYTVPFTWKVRRDPPPGELVVDWTVALGEAGWNGRATVPLGEPSPAGVSRSPDSTAPQAPHRPAVAWPWWGVLAAAVLGLAWALWPRTGSRFHA
jgi:DsbC/DsbD-like thiol-disulfide interchange protein